MKKARDVKGIEGEEGKEGERKGKRKGMEFRGVIGFRGYRRPCEYPLWYVVGWCVTSPGWKY